MNDLAHNASAFYYRLIDMGRVPSVWFPWQQQHDSREQLSVHKQNALMFG